ncbi:hypothetical protein S7711_08157 [Stachybotrys chartarum IBT 7711]|uniref:Telomere-associated protein Rif1 N-terminal domain-containing protein n=1 Tax=Stachybotrys chartarum (strain CBS 109288 / IBT 7711) TaxID=1280523 RepID=A0A084AIF9_STACB|nr:hypothetical protein S7711_08157 [Stachybotrys chartarum IBT 7711]
MASSALGPSIIEALPARPPTPPRESLREVDPAINTRRGRSLNLHFDPQSSLQTPPNATTPTLSVVSDSNPSSSRMRKKVEWAAHTEYKHLSPYKEGFKSGKPSPSSLLSSAQARPPKGILKPSSSPSARFTSLDGEIDGQANQAKISEMLDSTIKQLAGSDRDSKLDAYMMLSRALKTSSNLPDRVALQHKMSLFSQFIQRDVLSKNEKGAPDSSLANHALTLLSSLLQFQAFASALTSDFGIFIVDHAIKTFEDTTSPKDLVRHLLQVMAFQKFSAKVMTSDRVGRLVSALHNVENHVKGKSIVMNRLYVYKQLIEQSRTHMAIHSDWLKDIFTDMLSTVRDIRAQAISLGIEAGHGLRSDKHLMRKATEILQATNDDQTYIEFYIKELERMIKDRQLSSVVPQIWSVVILFLRCPLDRWQYFGPWLRLAQSAFNTSDVQTKQEANIAWCHYVYLSLHDVKLSPKALGGLCQPLLSQLRRKPNPKSPEEGVKLRKIVIGGICNLLYYAFTPGDDKYPPDMIWEVTVQPVMAQLVAIDSSLDRSGDALAQAARILTGLLDVTTSRKWRQDRIIKTPLPSTDELPLMDPKWVRRNSIKILDAAGPVLEKKFLDLANAESIAYRLWKAWVGSIAVASAKDVKVQEETAQFFSCAFELLCKIWTNGPSSADSQAQETFLSAVDSFIQILLRGMGQLPFTEKKLSMTTSNTFEPAGTPSHRHVSKHSTPGVVRSPLHHLFALLCSVPSTCADNTNFSDFLQSVFAPFLKGKTLKARFSLATDLLQIMSKTKPCTSGSWMLTADIMRPALGSPSVEAAVSPVTGHKLLGPDLREVVNLLEQGLELDPTLPIDRWIVLFENATEYVAREYGDAGCAISIIEPLSRVLLENHFTNPSSPATLALQAAGCIFAKAKIPRDRQAVEAARRRLWGNPIALARGVASDPFDYLYKLGNSSLVVLYDKIAELSYHTETATILRAVGAYLSRNFSQAGVAAICKLKEGLSRWVQDGEARLLPAERASLCDALYRTWDGLCADLVSRGSLERDELDQIETLLTAGFTSKHRVIVSKTAETWNTVVTSEEGVECSESLKSLVSSLKSKGDLILPSLDSTSGEFGAQTTSFNVANDISLVISSVTSSNQETAEAPARPSADHGVSIRRSSRKRRMDSTPEVAQPRQAKKASTPRLRHDNSQIQFAPIVSSPPVDESQHLTERQKEIRERQRENAGMLADLVNEVPPPVAEVRGNAARTTELIQNTTPKKETSFEDMMSLTPTPRRGQILHIDELNDPPSSPPEPVTRSHSLISQLQPRSRANSSLDNWDFSSPPGSPTHDRQQVPNEIELPNVVLTGDSVESEEQGLQTRQPQASIAERADLIKIIPSSFEGEDEISLVVEQASELPTNEPVSGRLSTPPRKALRSTSKGDDTPRSVDDEFVDARSSPDPSPAPGQELPLPSGHTDDASSSSGSEETYLGKFVVELASKPSEAEVHPYIDSSPEKVAVKKASGCIEVREESSSSLSNEATPRKERGVTRKLSSPTVPLPAANDVSENNRSEKKRKRTRDGPKHSDDGRKRRRSGNAEVSRIPDDKTTLDANAKSSSPAQHAESSPMPTVGVLTRRSAKKQQEELEEQQLKRDKQSRKAKKELKAQQRKRSAKKKDEGDTDEEVMSQLVSESNAASQSQASVVADSEVAGSTIEDSMIPNSSVEATSSKEDADKGERSIQERGDSKGTGILETLRGGLEQLRSTTLSRDEVYKIEDMLMDMKRELFEAEKRGRTKTKSRSRTRTRSRSRKR